MHLTTTEPCPAYNLGNNSDYFRYLGVIAFHILPESVTLLVSAHNIVYLGP